MILYNYNYWTNVSSWTRLTGIWQLFIFKLFDKQIISLSVSSRSFTEVTMQLFPRLLFHDCQYFVSWSLVQYKQILYFLFVHNTTTTIILSSIMKSALWSKRIQCTFIAQLTEFIFNVKFKVMTLLILF